MTLPISPATISASLVNLELGLASTAVLGFNDPAVRQLAGRPIPLSRISLGDLYGKSNSFIPAAVAYIHNNAVSLMAFDVNSAQSWAGLGRTSSVTNVNRSGWGTINDTQYTWSPPAISGATVSTIIAMGVGIDEYASAPRGHIKLYSNARINGVVTAQAWTAGNANAEMGIGIAAYHVPRAINTITNLTVNVTTGADGGERAGRQHALVLPGRWNLARAMTDSTNTSADGGTTLVRTVILQPGELMFTLHAREFSQMGDTMNSLTTITGGLTPSWYRGHDSGRFAAMMVTNTTASTQTVTLKSARYGVTGSSTDPESGTTVATYGYLDLYGSSYVLSPATGASFIS